MITESFYINPVHDGFKEMAHVATCGFCDESFDNVWPDAMLLKGPNNLLEKISWISTLTGQSDKNVRVFHPALTHRIQVAMR